MKKHVYTLYLARVNDPHERTIQYNFDSAEAVLSELIALSNIHGYKYPDDCVSESFEDSGIAERLNALLENLESR